MDARDAADDESPIDVDVVMNFATHEQVPLVKGDPVAKFGPHTWEPPGVVYERAPQKNAYYRKYDRMYLEKKMLWKVKTMSAGTMQTGDLDGAGNQVCHSAQFGRSCRQFRATSEKLNVAFVLVPNWR